MKNGLTILALAGLALLFAVGTARAAGGAAKAGDPVDSTSNVVAPAGGPGLTGSDPGMSWQAEPDGQVVLGRLDQLDVGHGHG